METHKTTFHNLEIESAEFSGTPHLWIQWKGTDVCCDIHCVCGYHGHFDGDFFYYFECPRCNQKYECGTHIRLYPIDKFPEFVNPSIVYMDDDCEEEETQS